MIKDNFYYYLFSDLGVPRLNYLTYNFPEIEPGEFSEYLLNNNNILYSFNFILNSIYPILKNSDNKDCKKSFNNLKNLLNLLYDDVLLEIWKINVEYLHHWIKENEIESYFQLIDNQKIITILIYNMYKCKELENNKEKELELKRTSSFLLIFLNRNNFTLVQEHEYFRELFSEFNEIFTKQEFNLILKLNPELIEF
ncbi:MAG: hypothetical protein KDK36_17810, partial [Leptospiraceae bacterium]|nr:hypothetical protein [Leptospiraceae bacterium]